MDTNNRVLQHAGMAKRTRARSRPEPHTKYSKLYIGQWLARLGRKQGEVARAAGINEGYMSELVAGKAKTTPSAAFLMAISEELGISVNALYREPPPIDVTESLKAIRPDLLEALSQILPAHTKRR